jgi:hypothetical protein
VHKQAWQQQQQRAEAGGLQSTGYYVDATSLSPEYK